MRTLPAEKVVVTEAHEGPVYVAGEHALYATVDAGIRRIDLGRLTVTAVPAAVVRPNGMFLGLDGRLLVCEQGDLDHPARISRVDPATGQLEVVVDRLDGLPLNSPNDVVVGPDGVIWFTDPTYGNLQGFRPSPALGDFVHRVDPATGRHDVVADGFDKPNGIALSPDGSVLYVTDSGANHEPGSFDPARPHHIEAFDVVGAHLRQRRLLAVTHPGFPDGLKVDAAGRVFASAGSGVQVFSPDGDRLAEIALPGAINFAFGGPHGDRLYITADSAVFVAALAGLAKPASDSRTQETPVTTGG